MLRDVLPPIWDGSGEERGNLLAHLLPDGAENVNMRGIFLCHTLELKMTRKHEYSHDNTYFHLRHLLSGVYWLVNQFHAISFIVSRGCHPASKSGALTDGIHTVIRHAK